MHHQRIKSGIASQLHSKTHPRPESACTYLMDLWEVPEWGSDAPESSMYPSLQAAGKIGRQAGKQSKRKEETVLDRLIQGTVRLSKVVDGAGTKSSPL